MWLAEQLTVFYWVYSVGESVVHEWDQVGENIEEMPVLNTAIVLWKSGLLVCLFWIAISKLAGSQSKQSSWKEDKMLYAPFYALNIVETICLADDEATSEPQGSHQEEYQGK